MDPDPKNRIGIMNKNVIMSHPFFKGVNFDLL